MTTIKVKTPSGYCLSVTEEDIIDVLGFHWQDHGSNYLCQALAVRFKMPVIIEELVTYYSELEE